MAGMVYQGGAGRLSYTSGSADRLSTHTQPKVSNYKERCLICNVNGLISVFNIMWQGNNFGEIGAARVRADLDNTDEFILSSLKVEFKPLKNLIQPGGDRRTWQMQWDYEGTFDPFSSGEYWFQGGFTIDAFRNFSHYLV